MNIAKLGKQIRGLREAHGFTQESFAMACGLDRSYMGSIERGTRNITVQIAIQIAKTLDVEVGELFPPIKELTKQSANKARIVKAKSEKKTRPEKIS